jgi:protein TonB
MEQPLHTLARPSAAQATPRRALGIVVVVAIHVIVIWALITGLAQQMMQKLPSELMAKVEETPPPAEKLPPPPPPEMVKPPPPFVPPPDINIQSEAPVVNTITTQQVVATPPRAKTCRHHGAGFDRKAALLRPKILSGDRRAPESGRHNRAGVQDHA